MPRVYPTLCLSLPLLIGAAHAADDIARVEVKAAGAQQQRRDDGAGRIVVGRDELVRYGDVSVADVLRRQPGIAINGGQVQLRGLGGGRTQFLIDGTPAPPGFLPDSLAPELIERIEILKSASADSSTQGIAGSINIVLRKAAPRWRTSATVAAERSAAGWSPTATLDLARPGDTWSGTLAAQLARTRRALHDTVTEEAPDGERITAERNAAVTERAALTPRMTWKSTDTTLAWQGLLDLLRSENGGSAREITLWGDPSAYPHNGYASNARTTQARSDVTGTHRPGEDVRLEWKLNVAHNRRRSDYRFIGSDAGDTPLWQRRVLSTAGDDNAGSSGKLRFGGTPHHALSAGWDGTVARRAETRLQQDADAAGAPLGDRDQRYAARVRRLALYAQDEWSPVPALDLYLGLRWEGLRTTTAGRTMERVASQAAVWSPVGHLLWRIPDSRDQMRVALTRSYKAPETRDLMPRRYTVNNANGPTNPDAQGNPALRPELAWGIDAAYERYFAGNAMLSVSAYGRRIADVILQQLFRDGSQWVTMPGNGGRASTRGVELDGRFNLSKQASARFTLARNWSDVKAVAGPGNRLGEQTPLVANAGLDYRFGSGTTAGFNWNVQGAGTARTSATQWRERGTLRQLTAYASWQAGHGVTLRLTGTDLLNATPYDVLRFDDGATAVRRATVTSGGRTLRLAAEVPL
ncbi:outer membrane receptor for ferrienterochelin and colicin [Pseudoduganella flava]|uniref:Outer membrane receptor for ferrienterochelin and colicin n=1 Tax=Pseudoduganella flava TaxID=871742 RepID=A0A562PP09_9BURK|nr:TonB-dependent receptor [Pseudoduganella flava]QGZ40646.1 TonB-dependent receptor plug domain-containing protein [Pseudoduganella flava]TWI46098.1 outer membrane receptor for ferrienterochelin and colicin [Pseudoduganella flava]